MTPCTVARQAPLSMGFPGQEYWSGLFPFPGRKGRQLVEGEEVGTQQKLKVGRKEWEAGSLREVGKDNIQR